MSDRPLSGRASTRRTSVDAASAIGSAKISSGTPTASAVAPFCHPAMAVAASRKPATQAAAVAEKDRRRLEVEDQEAEHRADERGEQHRFRRMAAHDQDRAARRAGERRNAGASPSTPSIRLKALVTPTSQAAVTGQASHPSVHVLPKHRDAFDQQSRQPS